jgi:hypothetical protein
MVSNTEIITCRARIADFLHTLSQFLHERRLAQPQSGTIKTEIMANQKNYLNSDTQSVRNYFLWIFAEIAFLISHGRALMQVKRVHRSLCNKSIKTK